ncbi:hypothetical protein D3C72_2158840 [compost metagenome]
MDGELLAWATPVAKAEWREPGEIAHRHRLAVSHAEHRAERAILHFGLAPVLHGEGRRLKRTARQTHLFDMRLIDILAGGRRFVA